MRTTEARPSRSARPTSVGRSLRGRMCRLVRPRPGGHPDGRRRQGRPPGPAARPGLPVRRRTCGTRRRAAGDTAAAGRRRPRPTSPPPTPSSRPPRVRAEQAAEACNGARWRLQRGHRGGRARHGPTSAVDRGSSRHQRDDLAGVVAASYQDGGDVAAVDAVLGSEGPEGLMGQMLAYRAPRPRWTPSSRSSAPPPPSPRCSGPRPRRRGRAQGRLLAEADQARTRPPPPRPAAQTAASSDRGPQGRARPAARPAAGHLGPARRSSGRPRWRRSSGASARPPPLRQPQRRGGRARPEAQRRPRRRPSRRGSRPQAQAQSSPRQPSDPARRAAEQPEHARAARRRPQHAAGVRTAGRAAAIAFAKAQLGEPYLWGAAGPDSGTAPGSRWAPGQAGGVRLPHYSVAQYAASTPIIA